MSDHTCWKMNKRRWNMYLFAEKSFGLLHKDPESGEVIARGHKTIVRFNPDFVYHRREKPTIVDDYSPDPPPATSSTTLHILRRSSRTSRPLERHKARLGALGNRQEYVIDCEETFAPMAKMTSVWLLLAIAASKSWSLYQMDVKNPFIHGDLKEDVYMRLLQGVTSPSKNSVCRLRKSLYGLKQTPGHEVNLKLSKDDGDLLPNPHTYRRLVGSLVYLTITRPDISYAVNLVSQFMTSPRHLHLTAVKRIIRYLLGTVTRGLYFSKDNPLQLTAYADADWADCQDTCRSTTGWCVYLGNARNKNVFLDLLQRRNIG
ncbi:retrovirus-related Pol polyprotein from transposon TNT 1-94 isoform X1 [Cinnamomum micranthum f. kanehirae]|uniref:Retrovirus-related Pol polyprotein from transposon TNT 1-94 isoform X1 n=1 Tax=Cinnamomum micranthum f. kanehirae TaxID=337451 RepID=A0A3S4NEL6_9MAGN|nr:retrovirus-related Pol polyprotein from transposon TNT 1-94 isoform X1 [Cinnamomum micranthum f. kanehirae]